MQVQSIPLSHPQPVARPVKRGALAVFRSLRLAAVQAKKVPAALAQASIDVREAWRESAGPNA
jgi:hypothetical protein